MKSVNDKEPLYKRVLCGYNIIGDLAEVLVGSAKVCWCCSFWRGVMWGSALGLTLSGMVYYFMT